MTRGKYAERAERRREVVDLETTVEGYRHAVARLTRERDEARSRAAALARSGSMERRRLRAERDEGVSPMVDALQQRLAEVTAERDKAREFARHIDRLWGKCLSRLIAHMYNGHRLNRRESFDAALMLAVGINAYVLDNGHENLPPEMAKAIERARGRIDVVKRGDVVGWDAEPPEPHAVRLDRRASGLSSKGKPL